MAYFVADEKLQGYYVDDGVTINIVKYHFECDDAASLPAQTAFIASKKVKISMASTAHTIDTDALYKMSSSGAWIQQSQPWKPLADYSVLSNKPQINGHTLTGNQSGDDLGLQNTLTFDNTPTQNSTNPVTSRGVWTDQQRQEAEIGVVANAGAKNLAVPFSPISTTDIAITTNSDGSHTFDCTDVAENRVVRVANIGDLPSGAYTFSGTTGGSSSTYMLGLYNTSASAVKYQHTNAEESYTGNVSGFSLRVRVIAGYSGKFTVYPMLRPAAITDPTFQPYAPTNRELYEMILALQ